MKGLNYLEACLKECNDETTLDFGFYNTLFKSYKRLDNGIKIWDNTGREIFVPRDSVFSDYDERYNILSIQL